MLPAALLGMAAVGTLAAIFGVFGQVGRKHEHETEGTLIRVTFCLQHHITILHLPSPSINIFPFKLSNKNDHPLALALALTHLSLRTFIPHAALQSLPPCLLEHFICPP